MDGRYDAMFLGMAQQLTGGIDEMLEVFFDFLYRKTDFFTGAEEKVAKDMVLKKFKQFAAKAKQDKKEREPEPIPTPGITEIVEDEPEPEKKETKPASKPTSSSSSPSAAATATATATTKAASANATAAAAAAAADPEYALSAEDSGDENEPASGKLKPNHMNGANLQSYVWGQTLKDVEIRVPITRSLAAGARVKARDCVIEFTNSTLKVGLKGQPFIINGKLEKKIRPDESTWTIEDGKIVTIQLEKVNQMEWWSSIVEGEPKINTKKVQPENSKLGDLEGETRSMVEEMMVNQRRKEMGLPSIKEQQKLDAIEKLKKAHPELDFSNAKIQ